MEQSGDGEKHPNDRFADYQTTLVIAIVLMAGIIIAAIAMPSTTPNTRLKTPGGMPSPMQPETAPTEAARQVFEGGIDNGIYTKGLAACPPPGDEYYDSCVFTNAILARNESLCKEYTDEARCVGFVRMESAIWASDPSQCPPNELWTICVSNVADISRNQTHCGLLDAEQQTQCRNRVDTSIAADRHDPALCPYDENHDHCVLFTALNIEDCDYSQSAEMKKNCIRNIEYARNVEQRMAPGTRQE